MAYAVLAATAISAVVGAYATYQQSQAQKSAAEFQSATSKQNAAIAENQARDIEARGADEEAAYRLRLAQLQGQQRVQLAATGADLGSGSFLDIFEDTAGQGTQDALRLRQSTERKAYAQRLEGLGFANQASLYRAEAAGISPGFNAGASLIGGSAGVADRWLTYKSAGAIK